MLTAAIAYVPERNDFEAIKAFVIQEKSNHGGCRSKDPLVKGFMTSFKRCRISIPVIGPSKMGAQLEGVRICQEF
jgi:phosphoribosylamine-glycine ligase